ncbi:TPA: hypothetical protein ACGTW6_004462 [Klebsiella aerogenes]
MIIGLDSLPKLEPYLWADFLELRASTSIDKSYSKGELSSLMRAQAEPEARDLSDKRWTYAVNFIRNRIAIFGKSYPFKLSEDGDTIYIKKTDHEKLTPSERLYLALLTCANIKYIAPRRRKQITNSFEQISLPVFKQLMPPGMVVNHCWANAGANAIYTGLLYDKMIQIAKDIRCKPNFEPDDYEPGDTGDGGIDILAYHPMGDDRDCIPVAMVQCGCSTTEWVAKQFEAHPSKLGNFLPVNHAWASYYFLPQDLRKVNGRWAHRNDIGQVIFVDRLRLINLSASNRSINHIQHITYVKELIETEYEED